MQIVRYHSPDSDALFLRKAVFVQEQGFVDDIDEFDTVATHLVAYDEQKQPIATCRVFRLEESRVFALGRFCVIAEMRGQGIGQQLLTEAERAVVEQGGQEIVCHAQWHAKGFYEKCGYICEGELEYEQDQPHIQMKKKV